jgi:hypothetical protein
MLIQFVRSTQISSRRSTLVQAYPTGTRKKLQKNFPQIWPNRFVSQDTHKIRKNRLSRPLTFIYDDFFVSGQEIQKTFS